MDNIEKVTMAERLKMVDKESNKRLLKDFLIWGTLGAILGLIVFL